MIDLYSGTPLSPALDIWALGCLFYVLLFNQVPFPTGKLAILSRKYTVLEHNIPAPVITFLDHMLTVDAKTRPTIVQVQSELKTLIATVKPQPVKVSGGGGGAATRPTSASIEHKHSATAAGGLPNGYGETGHNTKTDDSSMHDLQQLIPPHL